MRRVTARETCARRDTCVRRYHVARSCVVASTMTIEQSVCSRLRIAHRPDVLSAATRHRRHLPERRDVARHRPRPLLPFPRGGDRSRAASRLYGCECYFSGVTEEAEGTMFFGKPVAAAITFSEIGVFARPIGKEEPNSGTR